MSPNSIYFSDDALGDTVAMWIGLRTEKSGSDGSYGYRTKWVDGMYDAYTHFAPGTELKENQCFQISSENEKVILNIFINIWITDPQSTFVSEHLIGLI